MSERPGQRRRLTRGTFDVRGGVPPPCDERSRGRRGEHRSPGADPHDLLRRIGAKRPQVLPQALHED